MKVRIVTKKRLVIACPHCGGGEFGVEHLAIGSGFGPWICDACNYLFHGVVGNGEIEITKVEKRDAIKVLCLLRFRDLYVVVEGYSSDPEDSYDYLFHSHQCPVNIMRKVLEVFDSAKGSDPHGIFRYVAEIDDNEENRKALRDKGGFQDMLYLFKTDGTEAPTEWPEKERGLLPWIAALQDDAKTKA